MWSDLKNTAQLSSEDMDNVVLPPSHAVLLYSIARDGSSEERYLNANFVGPALSVVESEQFSKGPSVKTFGIDSTLECVTTLVGKF